MKWCPKCAKTLPVDSFAVAKSVHDGRHGYCRACSKLVSAEARLRKRSYLSSPEYKAKQKEYMVDWQAKNSDYIKETCAINYIKRKAILPTLPKAERERIKFTIRRHGAMYYGRKNGAVGNSTQEQLAARFDVYG